jgi:uncharacterized protein YebE (UPF0316 family)
MISPQDLDLLFSAPIGALLIFGLRVVDVSMAVMRTIIAVRGRRGMAACISFFEVLIWIVAAGYALRHLDSIFHVVGYAAGCAVGNYLGVWLEGRFALGICVVRAVVSAGGEQAASVVAAARLRSDGYAVTEMPGQGQGGAVSVLNTVVQRRNVPRVMKRLGESVPGAFITVEDIRSAQGGYVQPSARLLPLPVRRSTTFLRKPY